MTPNDAAIETEAPPATPETLEAHSTGSDESPSAASLLSLVDLAQGLDFAPSWAKGAPGKEIVIQDRDRGSRSRDSRDTRRPDGARRDAPGGRRPPPRSSGDGGGAGTRGSDNKAQRDRGPRSADFADRNAPRGGTDNLPPIRIRFVPDDKRLGVLVRKIHTSQRAYPLHQILELLLSTPDACRAKIELLDPENAIHFHVCRICGIPALAHETIAAHIVRTHLLDYFDVEDIQSEAPAGVFVCIQRCGLSGTLLGPPNHNSINDRIQEVHHTLYPDMPIEAYRRRIETLHDAALIEEWKEAAKTRKVYRRKGETEATPLRHVEAVDLLNREVVSRQIQEIRRALLPVSAGATLPDPSLRDLLARAWKYEQHQPRSLVFAVKAAFKNMQLHPFTTPKGEELVCSIRPTPLDPTHVVAVIRDMLAWIAANPETKRTDMFAHLAGEAPEGQPAPENKEATAALAWMIEKGHIIERFDGRLYTPAASR